VIRVGYLQQNAFHEYDSSVSLQKQFEMLKLINYTYKQCQLVLQDKKTMNAITNTHIFDEIVGIKYAIDEDLAKFDAYYKKVDDA
ncbi:V-type ATP synthase subunit A, partial [Erysipelothrix rhusiopathiae]|nr:V-type ATP synthase subunit A [Erysipelothrix rhusiopathiae]